MGYGILLLIFLVFLCYRYRNSRKRKMLKQFPSLPSFPIVGSALDLYIKRDELRSYFYHHSQTSRSFCMWIGWRPMIIISNAADVEVILSSTAHIDKSVDYRFLHPWLGTGLLTSGGSKWRSRRKMLTPTFHFRILEDFLHVFNEQSETLIKNLNKQIEKKSFDIFPLITHCAFDIICETSMGYHVNAQNDSDSPFVKATERIKHLTQKRITKILLWSDRIFKLTKTYKEYKECLQVLHNFTDNVIRTRKAERCKTANNNSNLSDPGHKPRLALLDLLLEASDNGKCLTDLDIREEIDTFIFEGHDTTGAAMGWALYFLGKYPLVQDKVNKELDSIFGNDTDRHVTMDDLRQMKYLECVIKEALRIFPSVFLIAREMKSDVVLEHGTVPAGVAVVIATYLLHRDEEVFPEAKKFDPDRFLPENSHNRHPYAYLPFSAGPRNCIGQKFALMEEKVVLTYILRKYTIESLHSLKEVEPVGELIVRPKNGIVIRLHPRQCSKDVY